MDTYGRQQTGQRPTSIDEIIACCKSQLPKEYQHRPYRYPELKNGTSLLETDEAMDAYIAAYGEMHAAKCRAALQNFPFGRLSGSIEIVDWGCGQGIGSLCTLEALAQRDKTSWLKRVTLIEPSQATLGRATDSLTATTGGSITIVPINSYLPGHHDDAITGLDYVAQHVIHVFSNILDIDDVDLGQLAQMVARPGHKHYVMCMGPVNANSYRIDTFCNIFGTQTYFSDLRDPAYGRTSDTYYQYTCKTKCFVYDGSPLDIEAATAKARPAGQKVYSEYDPRLAVQNGVMPEHLRDLYLILLSRVNLTDDDFIILQPDIKGDKPDIIVVRPHKGILIINLFDHDLNDYHLSTDEDEGNEINGKKKPKDSSDNPTPKTKRKSTLVSTDGSETIESPLVTIKTYQENLIRLHMKGMIEKVIANSRNWSLIKMMVLFTKNTQEKVNDFFKKNKDKYINCYGMELLTDGKEQARLMNSLYFTKDNPEFDDKTLRRFLRIISPGWHSYKEGKIVNLSTSQQHLVASTAGARQKISGVAGSGKTLVLVTRAVNAQIRTGKRILLLTFNKTLVNFVRSKMNDVRKDFPWDNIVINYYHRFFRMWANRLSLHLEMLSYNDVNFFESCSDKTERFAAIFIDEVQDYQTEWLNILNKYFLEEGGEFVVFGDPKQNIYQRELDKNGDINIGVIAGRWNHELTERQRFANPQLARLASDFQDEFYPHELRRDDFKGTVQLEVFNRLIYQDIGRTDDIDAIGGTVLQIINEHQLTPRDTVILSQASDILRDVDYYYRTKSGQRTVTTFMRYEEHQTLLQKSYEADYLFKKDKDALEHSKKLHFTTDTDRVKMATIHSFKGWESPNVILIIAPLSIRDAKKDIVREKYAISNIENRPELIYAAITRAKESLFIINLGNEQYHGFFNSYIKRDGF